jgi:hypothetical protein
VSAYLARTWLTNDFPVTVAMSATGEFRVSLESRWRQLHLVNSVPNNVTVLIAVVDWHCYKKVFITEIRNTDFGDKY